MLPRSTTTHENRIYKATFWAGGYAVSTVGFEEEQIRRYIRSQEQLETEGEDEDGAF
jgi:putative transposase